MGLISPSGPRPCRLLTRGRIPALAGAVSFTSATWDPKLEVAVSKGNHRLTVASDVFGVAGAFVGLQSMGWTTATTSKSLVQHDTEGMEAGIQTQDKA